MTVQGCRAECDHRRKCLLAVYNRRYALCGLSSRDEYGIDSTGIVALTGFEANPLCGDRICGLNEKCTYLGTQQVCQVIECFEPPRVIPDYIGSIYTVGSSIIYKGEPHGINLKRTCLPGGEWGVSETRVTSDCFDVTGPSGVYWQPDLDTAIFCDMDTDGGKWLVFQRRQDGTVDFYRNWKSYEDGFGHLYGEFWLGLKHVHNIVSSSNYELRIDMENFQGEHGYAKYSTFRISGQRTDYTLTVSGFTGDRDDSMTERHNGKKFTTFDRDNDLYNQNCARSFKGAWWYGSCHFANLNGLYDTDGISSSPVNIHWHSWTGYEKSLKKTSMKFRRKTVSFSPATSLMSGK